MRTSAELDFIKEMTRSLLVRWADYCLRHGHLPIAGKEAVSLNMIPLYLDQARAAGWISKSDPPRVLAKGYKAAASFLRR